MRTGIILGVYRRRDERFESQGKDSPELVAFHNLRKEALHHALDHAPFITVTDWGATDDKKSHEYVEVILGAAAPAVFQYAIVPGIKWLGQKLAEKAVDTAIGEFAKWVVAKFRLPQEAKQLLDINIKLPDGTLIMVDAPDQRATITIHFPNGAIETIDYAKLANQAAG